VNNKIRFSVISTFSTILFTANAFAVNAPAEYDTIDTIPVGTTLTLTSNLTLPAQPGMIVQATAQNEQAICAIFYSSSNADVVLTPANSAKFTINKITKLNIGIQDDGYGAPMQTYVASAYQIDFDANSPIQDMLCGSYSLYGLQVANLRLLLKSNFDLNYKTDKPATQDPTEAPPPNNDCTQSKALLASVVDAFVTERYYSQYETAIAKDPNDDSTINVTVTSKDTMNADGSYVFQVAVSDKCTVMDIMKLRHTRGPVSAAELTQVKSAFDQLPRDPNTFHFTGNNAGTQMNKTDLPGLTSRNIFDYWMTKNGKAVVTEYQGSTVRKGETTFTVTTSQSDGTQLMAVFDNQGLIVTGKLVTGSNTIDWISD